MEEIAELKSKIKVVEDQIQAVEDQIAAKDRNEEALKEEVKVSSGHARVRNERDLDYVREEKMALREEEKALREKEKALRDEQARKESTSLGSSSSQPGGQAKRQCTSQRSGVWLSGEFIEHDIGLEKLWKSLESTVQVGDFVALPDNFNNLFKQAPSHLYERVHYEYLTTFLRGLQNESTDRDMVSLGAAGTGKSSWLCSALIALCKSGETVLFQGHRTGSPKILSRRVCGEISRSQLKKIGDQNPSFYQLCDSVEPETCRAVTALASTPDKAKVGEFSKDAAERFLPDFAEPEIWALHSKVFPAVPVALVEELFSKWGGIPRMVLRRAKTHSTSDLDKLNAAIASSSKEGLLSACRIEDTQHASERVLRFVPKTDYSRGYRAFGSPYIASQVYAQLESVEGDLVSSFLYESRNDAACKSLHGYFFEQRTLKRLQAPARHYKTLNPDAQGTNQEAAPILLGGLRRRDFLDIDVVRKARLHNRILWVPKPGYEGVDAVADKNPVQITVSRNHTALSMTAIKEAIQAARRQDTNGQMLLYIVPEDLQGRIKKIPLVGTGQKGLQKRIVFMPYTKPQL